MSYVIRAILNNPECGSIAVSFPIPVDQYDQTIEKLWKIELGGAIDCDCTVDEVESRYRVLDALKGTLVNVDQLDYLAKRLDSFCTEESAQFQTMANKLNLVHIKDFINLTFCCQQATVITDFSNLEKIGKDHVVTLNGGGMPMEQYEAIDGRTEALQLIQGGAERSLPTVWSMITAWNWNSIITDINSPHILTTVPS